MNKLLATACALASMSCAQLRPAGAVQAAEPARIDGNPGNCVHSSGRFTLVGLVRPDGRVFAAFANDELGLSEPTSADTVAAQLHCAAGTLLDSSFAGAKADALVRVAMECTYDSSARSMDQRAQRAVCTARELTVALEEPLDRALAAATLRFLGSATPGERALGLAEVDAGEAEPEARKVLALTPTDPLARRALSLSLLSDRSNRAHLEEAHTVAADLAHEAPESVAAQEILARVCLAMGDDSCALAAFEAARRAPDQAARVLTLRDLEDDIADAREREKQRAADALEAERTGKPVADPAVPGLSATVRGRVAVPRAIYLEGDAQRAGPGPHFDPSVKLPRAAGLHPRGPPAIVGNERTRILTDGTNAASTLVLLHDLGGSALVWRKLLPLLAAQHMVLAIDLRGHGLASESVTGDASIGAMASDVIHALDALHVAHPVLVAHAFGAHIALAIAQTRPDLAQALLFIDPSGDVTEAPRGDLRDARDGLDEVRTPLTFDAFAHALLRGGRRSTRMLVLEELHDVPAPILRGAFESLAVTSPLPLLKPRLAVTRVLSTSFDDEPFSLHALVPELAQDAIANTSHWPMLDRPREVAQWIETSLAKPPR